ncbi:MAG: DUF4381 domain-containing protein [Chitinophagaceae bacterium]
MNEQYGKLIEPADYGFSFGAPGWYVLGVLLLLVLGVIAWLVIRYYQRNLYRKHALQALMQSETIKEADTALLYEANMLMKRIAMSKYGRSNTASIRNKEWIGFLNKTAGRQLFTDADARLLPGELYGNDNNSSVADFVVKTKEWIRGHRKLQMRNSE